MSSARFVDIGVNLTDGMFQGRYHGSETPYHSPDLDEVLSRAWSAGVEASALMQRRVLTPAFFSSRATTSGRRLRRRSATNEPSTNPPPRRSGWS